MSAKLRLPGPPGASACRDSQSATRRVRRRSLARASDFGKAQREQPHVKSKCSCKSCWRSARPGASRSVPRYVSVSSSPGPIACVACTVILCKRSFQAWAQFGLHAWLMRQTWR